MYVCVCARESGWISGPLHLGGNLPHQFRRPLLAISNMPSAETKAVYQWRAEVSWHSISIHWLRQRTGWDPLLTNEFRRYGIKKDKLLIQDTTLPKEADEEANFRARRLTDSTQYRATERWTHVLYRTSALIPSQKINLAPHTGVCNRAVSYTHLDVYKRQIFTYVYDRK